MMKKTAGIHHISAIVGHPQENVDFYASVLGLRLVKKTINFDDPGTYHLYFGNNMGEPGTIITFFPWTNAYQGRIGSGQVGVTSYAIPTGTMNFWEERLAKFNITTEKITRFGDTYLAFKDIHGLYLELVETENGKSNDYSFGDITPEISIKGFAGAILLSSQPGKTGETLVNTLGFEKVAEEEEYIRYRSYGEIGNTIDIKQTASHKGQMGVGTVHHIAFRAKNNQDHLDWQQHVANHGLPVTEVKDRNYFNAIYFKEHGEILFEIATDPPGFAYDESEKTMGDTLKLPSQYEVYRGRLEKKLIPIEIRDLDK
ncbi:MULTISPECIES: ring-cleaving dioxygenase [unclassified Oceanobacillus]|uniref:ring-cleaving dioxygenase n=1 Tax=unclassified Oceanobacillus TaxID=2630292 RepID=UPI00084E4E73|nr:ring-cleaving dioxygenase [Oceanobacillus sp. E9]MBT2599256.1 ring-cleaving dioxygenase [Oceanobacillus sp. ISL-74]MBT2652174.1 ring-cleaving dioxygenase [Oceanobacillus sp. ISL-73]OEH54185.1 ring-cleaving dioxygenase [Oceanobacillus sp. E9]